ncbi:hypothetical protein DXH95_08975 [Sphingorhabdus pulchriflava]|uniref:Uncharacterized protein n=1 Tax=Sphingorhabdus pulchriflava TaxID=2292257 RepID=A0A371BIS3_9SPHN|nr:MULTISPECIES: DUF5818 domain-containing protein [Sphingorhabdus]RDV07458.1 hypothetical protein DXH95_08975 [Sphingorhabdus pulchriflava]HMT40867.1 DUF5818 domain-containing protein [Sphingorhabdus sp.]HMU22087.1 DUF5818 domain-containing protein [Sphingorhabdus sp.]
MSGQVRQSRRGKIVKTDDNTIWVIEVPDDIEFPGSGSVIVEGTKIGFDRLRIDWFGLAV